MSSAIEQKLRLLPNRPGVYLMKNDKGKVIYIGKAKRLPPRVRSYFRGRAPDQRLQMLRDQIRDFDYVVTASETEALVLEANLVRSLKPKYNIELKDDKKYPFLRINVRHPFPRLIVTRTIRADGARYFGPYPRVKDLRQVLRALRRRFPLRGCTDRRLQQGGRECLEFFIGLCSAPCTRRINQEDYRRTVDQMIRFLEGHEAAVMRSWEREMRQLAAELRFEESARLRDDMERLKGLHEPQLMTDVSRPDLDVVALAARGNRAVAAVFSHREGKVVGTWRISVGRAAEADASEIIKAVISEHYLGRHHIPPLILCRPMPEDSALLAAWLGHRARRRVRFHDPQRGQKAALLRTALENAQLTLEESELIEAGKRKRLAASAYILQESLGLPNPPSRIEGYDISNIQGELAVGSQVVFRDGTPLKSAYRRFRIKEVTGPDDFAMMAEMLSRRIKRLEEGEAPPDLMLIDGGKGQVNRVWDVLQTLGWDIIPLAGLAKREEEIFRPGKSVPIRLPRNSPGLQLLQRVRDEAHRFAVEYHRSLRRRRLLSGPLEDIPGLGAKGRQALLEHFGSLRAIAVASAEQLAEVPGIGSKRAAEIARRLKRKRRR